MRAKQLLLPAIASGLLVLAVSLGGCVPVVVGGVAAGATVVAQERSVATAIDDSKIQADIDKRLLEFDLDLFARVDIEVVESKVLLTGNVPEPRNRVDAARIAWRADGVAEVINEIEITDNSTLSDAARDAWITTKLRARIIGDREISSVNYTIDTVNGAVYLMGIAQDQAELDRVVGHARDTNYVRRVVPHVRVKDAPAQTGGG